MRGASLRPGGHPHAQRHPRNSRAPRGVLVDTRKRHRTRATPTAGTNARCNSFGWRADLSSCRCQVKGWALACHCGLARSADARRN